MLQLPTTFYAAIILRCTRIQPEHDVGGGGEGEGDAARRSREGAVTAGLISRTRGGGSIPARALRTAFRFYFVTECP